jgi:hypothetical protein
MLRSPAPAHSPNSACHCRAVGATLPYEHSPTVAAVHGTGKGSATITIGQSAFGPLTLLSNISCGCFGHQHSKTPSSAASRLQTQSGETVEAREARIAATYEQALLCIQDGEQRKAVVRRWSRHTQSSNVATRERLALTQFHCVFSSCPLTMPSEAAVECRWIALEHVCVFAAVDGRGQTQPSCTALQQLVTLVEAWLHGRTCILSSHCMGRCNAGLAGGSAARAASGARRRVWGRCRCLRLCRTGTAS